MDAAFRGDVRQMKVLLAGGADPNVVSTTGHRYRPLHRAIEFKKTHRRGPEHEVVVKLLLTGGADPKLRGGWSRLTALQLAATGEWRVVPILREHFEPLDIFHAAAVAAADRVAALLNKSPELASAKDENGWTALHYCCASAAYQQGPREMAALVHIAQMLIEGGADVSATWVFDPQWPIPPLYHCCGQHDNPAVAEDLFQAGAQPYDNETVYHASDEDHRGALALIERYAKPKPLAEECTKCLLTQLHWGRARGAPWLLAHGADPTRKNKGGKTAFDLAAGKPRVLKLLRASS
jgi:ankyrin repeat protein